MVRLNRMLMPPVMQQCIDFRPSFRQIPSIDRVGLGSDLLLARCLLDANLVYLKSGTIFQFSLSGRDFGDDILQAVYNV